MSNPPQNRCIRCGKTWKVTETAPDCPTPHKEIEENENVEKARDIIFTFYKAYKSASFSDELRDVAIEEATEAILAFGDARVAAERKKATHIIKEAVALVDLLESDKKLSEADYELYGYGESCAIIKVHGKAFLTPTHSDGGDEDKKYRI